VAAEPLVVEVQVVKAMESEVSVAEEAVVVKVLRRWGVVAGAAVE
jgi:hypothetical protein